MFQFENKCYWVPMDSCSDAQSADDPMPSKGPVEELELLSRYVRAQIPALLFATQSAHLYNGTNYTNHQISSTNKFYQLLNK